MAVRGPRGQMDRDLYREHMARTVLGYGQGPGYDCDDDGDGDDSDADAGVGLAVLEGSVEDLLLDEGENITTLTPFGDLDDDLTLIQTLDSTATSDDGTPSAISTSTDPADRKARIRGVIMTTPSGEKKEITARCVVITTGTFLRGVLMLGHDRYSGGR